MAPVDGTVIARRMDVGQTVASTLNPPTIFEIAQDLTKMQVDTNVDESDVGNVAKGQKATFIVDSYPGTTFQGVVADIRKAPIITQNVVTYDVVITVDNSDLKLFPGMTANVTILAAKLDDTLKVPNSVLRFRPSAAVLKQDRPAGGASRQTAGLRACRRKTHGRAGQVWALRRQSIRLSFEPTPTRRTGCGEGDDERKCVQHFIDHFGAHGSQDVRSAMPALIETDGLTKTYTLGEVTVNALQGVTLTIERGSFVAIMGASGSGKSTLMNLLGCLDRPTSGRYWLDGVPVEGLDRDQLAEIRNQKIGFVFQNFNLLPRMSAMENVQLPLLYSAVRKRNADERARRVLALVGLAGREHSLPTQLSGGQQQRIAIARALINDPEILLADEPTGQLDSHTSAEIMGIFQQLNRTHGITIIVVTHSDEVARFASRVITFRDGRIVGDSRRSDFSRRCRGSGKLSCSR